MPFKDPAEYAAYQKRWREENREYERARIRKWYTENREYKNALDRKWYAENREYHKACLRARNRGTKDADKRTEESSD